jgi:hypothetical protein
MDLKPPPETSEATEVSSRMQIEATVGAEAWGSFLVVLGIPVGWFGFIATEHRGYLMLGLLPGAVLIGVGLLLQLLFDNYYVIDATQRCILLHKGFRFLGKGKETVVVEAARIAALGMNAKRTRDEKKEHSHRWSYTPVAVLWDGTTFQLPGWSDRERGLNRVGCNNEVRRWAAMLQCPWIDSVGGGRRIEPEWVLLEAAALQSPPGASPDGAVAESNVATAPPKLRERSGDSPVGDVTKPL